VPKGHHANSSLLSIEDSNMRLAVLHPTTAANPPQQPDIDHPVQEERDDYTCIIEEEFPNGIPPS